MYTHLGQVTLSSGEEMALGCVRCPDPSWGAQVIPLLGHKSRESREHFEQAFAGPLDELDTRFYVGTIGGIAVTNVMIVGALRPTGGVGILGHVYTKPEHRQKGAYGALMAAQMAHVRADGYRVLTLGTGFDTHPYWIYHRHGFVPIDDVTGRAHGAGVAMTWRADPDAERDLFAPAATHVRPLRWDDWSHLNLVTYQTVETDEPLPRSVLFSVKGQKPVEAPFQTLQRRLRRKERITALVLEAEHGTSVGWAALQPDPFAFGDALQLDLCIHRAFTQDAAKLLEALPLAEAARVNAYTSPEGYRAAVLERAGFRQTATLPEQLERDGQRVALHAYTRSA